ncbi:MAG TPA: M1 family metallopeptidase [Polyangiaceae bacterium]|nr:M1 family metallopeptidase [Polyangiaceae bacterium]
MKQSKTRTRVAVAIVLAWIIGWRFPNPARAAEVESEIPFVSPHAAAVEIPSAPNAWGGPRTGNETTLSDRVVKYEIDATLDPKAHTLDGEERLTWRNRSDRAVSAVYLHLYLNAFEGPGSTFFTESRQNALAFRSNVRIDDGEWGHIDLKTVQQNGVPVPWRFVHPDQGPETDRTVVRLDLPTPVPAGGSVTLDIAFHDQLPRVIARTGYFGSFHMVAQWFPKIGVLELPGERGATAPRWNVHEFHMHSEFYADWGEYDVRMTVPKGFQVASAGEEQGAPIAKGELVTHRFTQNDIHDFAWMAVDNFEPPLQAGYDGPGSPHVKVQVFYPAEYVASARRALQATLDSIKWFSDTLGPYPYRTSTCIIPPYNAIEAGGMEYQTIFTADGFLDAEPDTFHGVAVDFVTIHEFGHGYFYGLLASNEFEEPFLDEGLNEFWDIRMLDARREHVHISTPFLKMLGFDPSGGGFALQRIGGALDPHLADPIGQNAWDRVSTRSYGQVYSRTAIVMHDLEARLGTEALERGFRAYYAKWHFRHPSTADLREALAEATGNRLAVEQVFRQNVYGAEAIDDRIESLVSDEQLPEPGMMVRDGKWIERTRDEVDKEIAAKKKAWKLAHPDAKKGEGPYPFRTTVTVRRDGAPVPQTLLVKFEDGSSESVRWDDDVRWRRFTFVKPIRAKSAELDQARHHYLDYDKLNDGRTFEPDRSGSRRWGLDLSAVVEVLYALLGAL